MPNYSHPHDEFRLNDNTVLVETTSQNTEPVLFQPFFSSKGLDNKIVDLKTYSKTYSEYGEPDISLYGQAYYQVLNWLENGGSVKGIRLTAKNATYANNLLILDIKVVEIQKTNASGEPLFADPSGAETTISSGNTPIMIKKANVKHRLETFTNIAHKKEDIKTLMRSKFTEDEDGLHLPLLCTVCKGKGIYGKMYRYRLTPAVNRDKETTYRNYNFEIYKNENGLEKDPNCPINVSSYPSARNIARQSEYIEDVVGRQDYPVNVYALDDAFRAAFAKLYEVVAQEDPEVKEEAIDVFTFYNKNMNRYKYVEIDSSSIDVTALEGHGLESGSDGDFATTNPNRWDAMYDRLSDLFKGNIDASIKDIREHQFKLTLDANFPLEIKKQMESWRNLRDDAPLVLDSSLMYSVANLKAFLKEELRVNNFGVWINTQNFDVYDKYTGKNITVTTNYLWSILLPQHLQNKGSHVAFAGLDIPLNEYIIEGSLRPTISEDTDKTEIYDLRGNYIEKESNKYIFATNVTSQSVESELSYTNNVFVYYEIKADLKSLSAIFRFKFSDSDNDFKTLNKLAQSKVEKYQDAKCKKIEVEVKADTTDPKGKTVKTICKVGFKNFDLNNSIEVNIDRY